SSSANSCKNIRRFHLPSCWKRLNARNPIAVGDGCQVRSFHSPNFECISICSRHPAVGLEQLNVEALRWERQGDEDIYSFRTASKVFDFEWRCDGQPKLPCQIAGKQEQQDVGLSRSEGVAQHGLGRPHELKH